MEGAPHLRPPLVGRRFDRGTTSSSSSLLPRNANGSRVAVPAAAPWVPTPALLGPGASLPGRCAVAATASKDACTGTTATRLAANHALGG